MAGSERRAEVRQIGPGERNAADHPGDGEDGRNDVGRMRRATLQRVQHLADRALIVVGGAQAVRLHARVVRLGVIRLVVYGDRRRRGAPAPLGRKRRLIEAVQMAVQRDRTIFDVQCFLDRRQCRFGRVHHLRIVGHFRSSPRVFTLDQDGLGCSGRATSALIVQFVIRHQGPPALISCCRCPSYRFGGSKETGFGNVPLIIVNGLVTIVSSGVRQRSTRHCVASNWAGLRRNAPRANARCSFSPRLWKAPPRLPDLREAARWRPRRRARCG